MLKNCYKWHNTTNIVYVTNKPHYTQVLLNPKKTLARIIWSWQCCKLLVGNIANGIAFKKIFTFLTELGNFKQNFFLEAMPLAMLPNKSLQHCQEQMILAIAFSRNFLSVFGSKVYYSLRENMYLK